MFVTDGRGAFVTDGRGAFVKDLTADDFEILDGDRPQKIFGRYGS